MPFRFKLASLLRIRSMREELERSRFEAAALKFLREKTALTEIRDREEKGRIAFLAPDRPITGSELLFQVQCSRTSIKAELNARELCEQASRMCEHQREIYQRALRELEILKKLEQRQRRQFLLQEARTDQQQLDEAFTLATRHKSRQPLPSE